MNIFVLDQDLGKCAEYHCDKHVVKMILEYAQMLSTTVRLSGIDAGYKPTHKNHPCTKWVTQSLSNWRWLKTLASELNDQYKIRYEKITDHKSWTVISNLPEPNIPDTGLTEFVCAMPDQYKSSDPVQSYRDYYRGDKKDFATWRKVETPKWFLNEAGETL